MYKKILYPILVVGLLSIIACEPNQSNQLKNNDNKIAQCLNKENSEESMNACFKDFLSVESPTRLIVLEFDKQLATRQYLSDRIDIFNYRLSQLGITEASINSYQNKYIIILIPNEIKNTQQEIIKQLETANSFEIRLAYRNLEAFQILANHRPVPKDKEIISMPDGEPALVSRKVFLTENNLQAINVENNSHNDHPTLGITLNTEGAKQFYQLTRDNVSKHLATLVKDGTTSNYSIVIVAMVTSPIADGRVSLAGQSRQETKKSAEAIRASIPAVPLNIIVNTILK